jgi:hypothetical protein
LGAIEKMQPPLSEKLNQMLFDELKTSLLGSLEAYVTNHSDQYEYVIRVWGYLVYLLGPKAFDGTNMINR